MCVCPRPSSPFLNYSDIPSSTNPKYSLSTLPLCLFPPLPPPPPPPAFLNFTRKLLVHEHDYSLLYITDQPSALPQDSLLLLGKGGRGRGGRGRCSLLLWLLLLFVFGRDVVEESEGGREVELRAGHARSFADSQCCCCCCCCCS